jgi:hypothetical protein
MPLPFNETAADIRIGSVEPLAPSGLDILGILASHPGPMDGITSARGFPPPGAPTEPIAGAALHVRGSPDEALYILIGVRRQPNAAAGVIEVLRVRYEAGGRLFEVVFPWSLRVVPPES